jgi:hypothetical protein
MVSLFSQRTSGGLGWIEELTKWQKIYIILLLGICSIPSIWMLADFLIKKFW